MFGHRYYGARYFGPRYWGDGGTGTPVPPVVRRVEPDVAGGYHTPYRKGEKRKRGLEWTKGRSIEDLVEEVYQRLYGDPVLRAAEPALVEKAVAVAEPHSAPHDTRIPPPAAIDIPALAENLRQARQLVEQYQAALQRQQEADEDEDAILTLMMT